MAKDIRKEIDRLNAHINALLPVNRMIVKVQIEQLAKAEKLRKLAMALVNSTGRIDAKRGTREVSAAKAIVFELFVADLTPFHNPRARLPNSVQRFLAKKYGIERTTR